MVDAVTEGRASAALIASIVHYGEYTIGQLKQYWRIAACPSADVVGMSGMTTGLVGRDLLDLEQRLRDSLYRVLPFEAHAVYFPRQTRSKEPEWLPDEGKLLLPLVRHGELLGVFMARVPTPSA